MLYILILGFFVFGGLFKKNKKKAETAESGMPPIPPIPKLDHDYESDVWSELKSEEKEEKQISFAEMVRQNNEFVRTGRSNTLYADSLKESRREQTEDANQVFVPYEEDAPLVIELDDVEEVRKAVIYSEIFQRKY